MTREEAILLRLHNQQLLCPRFEKPEETVDWMGMVQAQDYSHFLWAIGMRTMCPRVKTVTESLSSGKILRLHLLRCTVQAVTAEDYPLMHTLCSERNLRTIMSWPSYNQTTFSEQFYNEGVAALREILQGGLSFTKKEISNQFATLGLPADTAHLNQVLLRGETEGLLCSGAYVGREQTWTLVSNVIPNINEYRHAYTSSNSQIEALAVLARKYFRSHSPASLEDFCWWTGLPVTLCRKAIQQIATELEEEVVVNQPMYIYKERQTEIQTENNTLSLLPPYDEYLIGYKSRWVSLDKRHEAKAHNNFGIFKPVVLYQGRVVGNWKTTTRHGNVSIETDIFSLKREIGIRRLQTAEQELLQFLTV